MLCSGMNSYVGFLRGVRRENSSVRSRHFSARSEGMRASTPHLQFTYNEGVKHSSIHLAQRFTSLAWQCGIINYVWIKLCNCETAEHIHYKRPYNRLRPRPLDSRLVLLGHGGHAIEFEMRPSTARPKLTIVKWSLATPPSSGGADGTCRGFTSGSLWQLTFSAPCFTSLTRCNHCSNFFFSGLIIPGISMKTSSNYTIYSNLFPKTTNSWMCTIDHTLWFLPNTVFVPIYFPWSKGYKSINVYTGPDFIMSSKYSLCSNLFYRIQRLQTHVCVH